MIQRWSKTSPALPSVPFQRTRRRVGRLAMERLEPRLALAGDFGDGIVGQRNPGGIELNVTAVPAALTVYVSSAGNDAWDGRAAEYRGGTSGPWRTLGKVNQQMAALANGSVLFRRGDRFEGRLEITGTNIIFGAYGSEVELPLITGARTLSGGWSAVSGRPSVYQTQLPAGVTEVAMVARGDQSLPLGRTPNGDLGTTSGYYTFSSRTATSITDPELTAAGGLVGSQVVVRRNNWSYDAQTVTAISGTTVTFSLSNPNDTAPTMAAAGYFFQKHVGTLDVDGEWFFEESTRNLYLYSATNPNQTAIAYSAEPEVVRVTSATGITLQGLRIEMGVSFGVNASSSKNLKVLGCDISRIGRDGVRLVGTSALVEGNTIIDCLGNGLHAEGIGSVVVTRNVISNIGLIPGRGWNSGQGMANTRRQNGITIMGGKSEASYNRLSDIGYVAIHHLGRENLVRRNVIERFNRVVFDGGAIYTYGNQTGTVLEENFIFDGMASDVGKEPGSSADSSGIQFDRNTIGVVARNNVIAYLRPIGIVPGGASGVHLNYDSRNNTVSGNTIVVPNSGISTLDRETSLMGGNTFDDNVIVRTTGVQRAEDPWALISLRERATCDLASQGVFRNNVLALPFTGGSPIYEEQANCNGTGGKAFTTWHASALDWNSAREYASGNLDSPLVVDEAAAPADFIQLYSNDSDEPRSFPLPSGTYKDAWGVSRAGSITVDPWRATVLFKVPGSEEIVLPAPAAVSIARAGTTASLAWRSPPPLAGVENLGYVIQWSSDGGQTWQTVSDSVPATEQSYQATNLTKGQQHAFRVAARSVGGVGAFTEPVDAVDDAVVFQPGADDTVTSTALVMGTTRIIKRGPGTLILDQSNAHAGGTIVEAGELVVRHARALGTGFLDIRPGGRITLDGGTQQVEVAQLTIAATATLDLGVGSVRVGSTSQDSATIRGLIASAWSGGSWTGPGITSSTIVPDSFRQVGYRVLSDGSLTIGLSAVGDANMDGRVDIYDLVSLNSAGKYGASGSDAHWFEGDFNYDGRVTIVDLILLDASRLYRAGPYAFVPAASPDNPVVTTGASAAITVTPTAAAPAEAVPNPIATEVNAELGWAAPSSGTLDCGCSRSVPRVGQLAWAALADLETSASKPDRKRLPGSEQLWSAAHGAG